MNLNGFVLKNIDKQSRYFLLFHVFVEKISIGFFFIMKKKHFNLTIHSPLPLILIKMILHVLVVNKLFTNIRILKMQ